MGGWGEADGESSRSSELGMHGDRVSLPSPPIMHSGCLGLDPPHAQALHEVIANAHLLTTTTLYPALPPPRTPLPCYHHLVTPCHATTA